MKIVNKVKTFFQKKKEPQKEYYLVDLTNMKILGKSTDKNVLYRKMDLGQNQDIIRKEEYLDNFDAGTQELRYKNMCNPPKTNKLFLLVNLNTFSIIAESDNEKSLTKIMNPTHNQKVMSNKDYDDMINAYSDNLVSIAENTL